MLFTLQARETEGVRHTRGWRSHRRRPREKAKESGHRHRRQGRCPWWETRPHATPTHQNILESGKMFSWLWIKTLTPDSRFRSTFLVVYSVKFWCGFWPTVTSGSKNELLFGQLAMLFSDTTVALLKHRYSTQLHVLINNRPKTQRNAFERTGIIKGPSGVRPITVHHITSHFW